MTNRQYTEAEIEAAFDEAYQRGSVNYRRDVLAELRKPKLSFRDGEVVAVGNAIGPYGYQHYQNTDPSKQEIRHLKYNEEGQHVHDLRDGVVAFLNDEIPYTELNYIRIDFDAASGRG